MDYTDVWTKSFNEAYKVLAEFYQNPEQIKKCNQMSQMLIETFKSGGNVFSCGNGGSHCDAMHFAEEFTGRYRDDRKALGALALGDPSHVTCVSNDYGFEHIFSRQLDGLGRKGDMMIALSTSGNSDNIIKAVEVAKDKGIKTVGLLGKGGGKLKDLVDLSIVVPANTSDRVQEVHIKILHTVIETAERAIFPENYA